MGATTARSKPGTTMVSLEKPEDVEPYLASQEEAISLLCQSAAISNGCIGQSGFVPGTASGTGPGRGIQTCALPEEPPFCPSAPWACCLPILVTKNGGLFARHERVQKSLISELSASPKLCKLCFSLSKPAKADGSQDSSFQPCSPS